MLFRSPRHLFACLRRFFFRSERKLSAIKKKARKRKESPTKKDIGYRLGLHGHRGYPWKQKRLGYTQPRARQPWAKGVRYKTADIVQRTILGFHKHSCNCTSLSLCEHVLHGRPLDPCGRMDDVYIATSHKSKLCSHSEWTTGGMYQR